MSTTNDFQLGCALGVIVPFGLSWGSMATSEGPKLNWDVFICHASEDKSSVARPLAELLRAKGLRVWLDATELALGDSLRSKIEYGLAASRYGIVILSKAFFEKDWPQRELNGLSARESSISKVILPIWHGVDRQFVAGYSPILADKLAANSESGLNHIADEVEKVVRAEIEAGSPNFLNGVDRPKARRSISKKVQGARKNAKTIGVVAELYYLRGLSHKEIAHRLRTNEVSVARLIKNARETGVVAFGVDPTLALLGKTDRELSRELRDVFKLSDAAVVDVSAFTSDDHAEDQDLHLALGGSIS